MATNLRFVPGRRKDSENPILDGFRFVIDKRKNDTCYWRCSQYKTGCGSRITTVDKQLTSTVPSHNHDAQHAEETVFNAKQSLKRRAATADHPSKYLVSEAVSGMGFEARSKLGCQLSSLTRSAQRSRRAASRHPSNPHAEGCHNGFR